MFVITSIEKQKRKNDRVNIYVNGEFYCAMQEFVAVKYGLKPNLETTEEHLKQLVLESDKEKALNKTLKLISKSLKTEKGIVDYLHQKGYDDIICNYVIEKLKEYNYINDENYIKSYINTYSGKYGKKKIEFELIQKGVNKELVKEYLKDQETDTDVILNLAKKYLKSDVIKDFKTKQKLYSHLLSKGFDFDEVKRAMLKLKQNKDINELDGE